MVHGNPTNLDRVKCRSSGNPRYELGDKKQELRTTDPRLRTPNPTGRRGDFLTQAADAYIATIKEVVLAGLSDEDVSIALFGSMANKKAQRASDVDVAIVPRDGWDRRKLVLLRERLENLNTPYRVELVDFSSVSEKFREIALRTVIWWRK